MMSPRLMPLIAAAMLAGGCSSGDLQGPAFATAAGGVGDFAVRIGTVESRKFATVVRQKYDFSCGSAALATLLRHHYGLNEDEEGAFRGMWASGDRARIRKLGFSLLDMKRHLAKLGYSGDGFKVSLDEVAKARVPGIALINVNGYKHFVVVKGVTAQEVLVGDPALGLRSMKRSDFQTAWNGIYFALNSKLDQGRSAFNKEAQWAQYARAPIRAGFADPVSQQALMLSAPFYRDF